MTEQERDAEFGRLLRERSDTRQTIACLKSKLMRVASAYRMAAIALGSDRVQWDLEKTPDGLVVPEAVENYPKKRHVLPELDELARWIREKGAAEDRLAELNELLPD